MSKRRSRRGMRRKAPVPHPAVATAASTYEDSVHALPCITPFHRRCDTHTRPYVMALPSELLGTLEARSSTQLGSDTGKLESTTAAAQTGDPSCRARAPALHSPGEAAYAIAGDQLEYGRAPAHMPMSCRGRVRPVRRRHTDRSSRDGERKLKCDRRGRGRPRRHSHPRAATPTV
ncbi:hypothetical protein L226DRAFT_203879 [Lentinus tigrinus ALCF2SS1-7]|nr:hypothetical protein L226DRAFT_203879 [Lentinus tigrinus ALCF2SS1-7]